MRTAQHVLDNFLYFVDSGVLVRDGMKHNPEHVYDIVSIWSGHAVLPFELDLASIKKVALPVHSPYRSDEEVDSSFDEFLREQAELLREQGRTIDGSREYIPNIDEAETIRSNG
jgi:hypothetical protein